MSARVAPSTGHTTVEELIRYAAHRFAAAGVTFRPPRMSRLIRSLADLGDAKTAIDAYLADRLENASWYGFELYVNGYQDPTGAHAARNVDLERGGAINTKAPQRGALERFAVAADSASDSTSAQSIRGVSGRGPFDGPCGREAL